MVLLVVVLQGCSATPGPATTIGRYLSAWSRGDYGAMAALVLRPPSDFVSFNRQVAAGLDLERGAYRSGPPTVTGRDPRHGAAGPS